MTAVWPTKNSRPGISTRTPQTPGYHTPSTAAPPNTEVCAQFGSDTTDHEVCNNDANWKAGRAEEEVGRGVESHEYSLPQKEAEGEAAVETVPLFTGAAEQVASQGEERPARAGDSCTQTVTQG